MARISEVPVMLQPVRPAEEGAQLFREWAATLDDRGVVSVSALELLHEFSALQQRVVQAFLRTAAPQDMDYFTDVADGHLSVEGEKWKYKRHGRGVRFVCGDGRVVDVHIGMDRHPAGITAWRLLQYLDSVGVKEVVFQQTRYASEDEAELERLLAHMERAGAVQGAGGHLYEPILARGFPRIKA